jgi:hypothetical protein
MATKKNILKSFANASNFIILRYPIPATFGVPGMTTVVQHALNVENVPGDTTILGYTKNHGRVLMLYVAPDGSQETVKRHCQGRLYDVLSVLGTSKGRSKEITEADLVDLLTFATEAAE